MVIQMTVDETTQAMEVGLTYPLPGSNSVILTAKGVLRLSERYENKRFSRILDGVRVLDSEGNWNNEVILRRGIIQFDILGVMVTFEVTE